MNGIHEGRKEGRSERNRGGKRKKIETENQSKRRKNMVSKQKDMNKNTGNNATNNDKMRRAAIDYIQHKLSLSDHMQEPDRARPMYVTQSN